MTIREIVESKEREAAKMLMSALQKWQVAHNRWSQDRSCAHSNFVAEGKIGQVLLDAIETWDSANPEPEIGAHQHFESFAIAILTDPNIGFKEALEWVHNRPCGSCDAFPPCEGLPNGTCNGEPVDSCTCPCHTAEAKLEELKELSK